MRALGFALVALGAVLAVSQVFTLAANQLVFAAGMAAMFFGALLLADAAEQERPPA